jgi:hypothetical protein
MKFDQTKFMPKEREKYSISINLRLTEAIFEKIIMIFLTSFVSFNSGIIYANNQIHNLLVNRLAEDGNNTVK